MITKLWVEAIINNQKTYAQVPSKLKDKVKAELIAQGREDLIIE